MSDEFFGGDEHGGEMVNYERERGSLTMPQSWLEGKRTQDIVTSIDRTTKAGKQLILRSLGTKCRRADEFINVTSRIEHVLFHTISITDQETGQRNVAIRTVVVTDKGDCVQFVSQGVVESLSRIAEIIGHPPWKPGLPLTLRRVQSSGANSILTFEYDGE